MKKRAIIVHCWGGSPIHCWYPKVKEELEAAGFEVEVPKMPNTDHPKLSEWLEELGSLIGKADENLYLIGHSLGCITIMRYLEILQNEKVGGVVLVAGCTDEVGFAELKPFFAEPIQYNHIREHTNGLLVIHSDNDPLISLPHAERMRNKLKADWLMLPNMGHFTGPVGQEGSCTSLPEVTQAVIKWTQV